MPGMRLARRESTEIIYLLGAQLRNSIYLRSATGNAEQLPGDNSIDPDYE
jgi:hypothetical protein